MRERETLTSVTDTATKHREYELVGRLIAVSFLQRQSSSDLALEGSANTAPEE